ncbi:hypothetical protein [Haloarcula sp. JP-L23]|uniref:DUF7518 family protein n=1 Tax=Haloarcula sp. JP-L23 TaxID=2716717 RepID=UPI00140F4578|nr:hypothetical protein G9465_07235 [Haloarcula sp. JP-L23]
MCGNRVEELEEQVQELQASVEGLTDELVECKVRLREVENTVDEDSGFGADAHKGTARNDAAAPEQPTNNEDEILTPEADTPNTEATDNTDKEAEAASESESEEDSGSDIIVA